MAKVLCYDIDGVVTVESDTHHEDLAGSYIYRSPNFRVRDQILRAFKQGWTVILFTGRREWQRRLTEDYLASHGFHYHFLFCNKPYFSFVVDDRARSLDEVDAILDNELVGKTGGEATLSTKIPSSSPSTQNDPSRAEPPVNLQEAEPTPADLPELGMVFPNVDSWLDLLAESIHRCSIRGLDNCGIHIPGLWDRVRELGETEQRLIFLTEVTTWFRERLKKRLDELEVKRSDEATAKAADKARKAQAGEPPHGELRGRPVEDEGG